MEILKAIDLLLQNAFVRWGMLALVAATTAYAFWLRVELGVITLQRDTARGESAQCNANIEVQNAAILRAAEDRTALAKQIAVATKEAGKLATELENKKRQIRDLVLADECASAVQQIVNEVKK